MKKLQCEVCKSSLIKKTSDDEFICETCGMKYTSNSIAGLLVCVDEQTPNKSESTIEDMLVNAHRYTKSNDWRRVRNTAEKILEIDPKNPDALLLLGSASAYIDPSNIKLTFPYALDAVKAKAVRTQDQTEFYNFLNFALKVSCDALSSCLELADDTYQESFRAHSEQSIQENIRYNEEQYRRAVTKGDTYVGRTVESPTILDSIGNAILATMDANNVKDNILALADTGMLDFLEYLEGLNLDKLDENGVKGYLIFLTRKNEKFPQPEPVFKYHELNTKKIEIAEFCTRFEKLKEKTSDKETNQAINALIWDSQKIIKKIEKLERDETFGLAPGYGVFAWLLLPGYGCIGPLANGITKLRNLQKAAKESEVPEPIIAKAKKKSLICIGVSIVVLLLTILSIPLLLSL